jgi:NAD(P)-dependent dehydrogenase (short-subunit alcohol dehydrogenase family)
MTNVKTRIAIVTGSSRQMLRFAKDKSLELRPIELDVLSQESVDNAIADIMWEQGRIDVVVHKARAAEYDAGPYANYGNKIMEASSAIVPRGADASAVGEAIAKIVDTPFGKRPFRVHIDPTQNGAVIAFAGMDRVRSEMLHRVGLAELLVSAAPAREQ